MKKYTHDEILNMQASRELDALIAEKVMGWKKILNASKEYPNIYANVIGEDTEGVIDRVPDYSTDLASVWMVVEKLRGMGAWLSLSMATIYLTHKGRYE